MTTDHVARLTSALADRYRIEHELGAGGMATVYLADDLKHKRQVAVKVLRPELAAVLGAERFVQEIETTAKLQHPHILPLFDSGRAEAGGDGQGPQEFLYYVMPYIDGETLRDRLNRETQLGIDEAVKIASDVADALDHAHRHGVIHRDIKPENILLHEGRALVADFGIALATYDERERLTETGLSLGTPHYMSPEQALGERAVDARSDVYALAAVLYEMITGEPPHTGPTAQAIIARIMTEPPRGVRVVRHDVPIAVESAILKALRSAPADRFGTAAEFRRALKADGGDTKGVPGSVAPAGNRRTGSLAAGVLGAAVLGAIAWFLTVRGATQDAAPSTILVMSFELIAPDSSDRFIADGVAEEIRRALATDTVVAVLGRRTALEARTLDLSTSDIGETFAVDYVLDGVVQVDRQGDGVRLVITPALTSTADGAVVWNARFDRQLQDLLTLQATIAGQVTASVGTAVTTGRRSESISVETGNPRGGPSDPRAMEAFLHGEEHFMDGWPVRRPLADALREYDAALSFDSTFALAHAKRALTWMGMFWSSDGFPDEGRAARRDSGLAAAERALRWGPDLAEAHFALGMYHYMGRLDYEQGVRHMQAAVNRQPNRGFFRSGIGALLRRSGQVDAAAVELGRASDLDPANSQMAVEARRTYTALRDFDEAARFQRRIERTNANVRWENRPLMERGDVPATLALVVDTAEYVGVSAWRAGQWPIGRTLCRAVDCSAAVARVGAMLESPDRNWALAKLHAWLGDTASARTQADSALTLLNIPDDPSDPNFLVNRLLRVAMLSLSPQSEAGDSAYVRMADSLVRASTDEWIKPGLLRMVAEYHAVSGDADAAIGILRELLSRPSFVTRALLEVDPHWDPIRAKPGFAALLRAPGGRS